MSTLLYELGLDPDNFIWQDLALCKGMPTEVFYDLYEKDGEVARSADQACLRCPVISQCFMAGSKGEYGQWGGIYWNGAGKPDKNKNSHKTPETWENIYERVRQVDNEGQD